MTLLPSRREPFLTVLRWLPGGRAEPEARDGTAPEPWRATGQEPPLDDMLADPIVQAVMASDRVSEGDVRAVVESATPAASKETEPPRRRRHATQRPW